MPNEVLAERTQHRACDRGWPSERLRFGGTNPNSPIKSPGGVRTIFRAPPFLQNLQNEFAFSQRNQWEDAISVLARTLAEQTQRPAVGVTPAFGCCHFGRTAERITPLFAREISALRRARLFGETNPMRCAAGATSAIGSLSFWRNKPNAVCRGRFGRKAKGGRDARCPGPPTFFRPTRPQPDGLPPRNGASLPQVFRFQRLDSGFAG